MAFAKWNSSKRCPCPALLGNLGLCFQYGFPILIRFTITAMNDLRKFFDGHADLTESHMLAKFKSLHDPWCDTSTPQGELLVTILAGFATFERHLIKARTDAGRKRAKARGVRFGRPRKLDPHQRQEALQRLAHGETLVDVARTYAVDPTTIGRLLYNGV